MVGWAGGGGGGGSGGAAGVSKRGGVLADGCVR